jgi:hypothetical protein
MRSGDAAAAAASPNPPATAQPGRSAVTGTSADPVASNDQPSLGARMLGYVIPSARADEAPGGPPTPGRMSALSPAKQDDGSSSVPAPASAGATTGQGGQTILPAPVAKVAPDQQGPTVQSSPPVRYTKDPVDPRPFAMLANRAPQTMQVVSKIAEKYGVEPQFLAAIWNRESQLAGDGENLHYNKDGSVDIGPFQINSDTLQRLRANKLIPPDADPRTVEGGATIASAYLQSLQAHYGQSTWLTAAAYNGGPGRVDEIKAGKGNPAVMSYADDIFMGRRPDNFAPPISINPDQFQKAAQTEGPQGAINFLAKTNPGVPMDDKWRAIEAAGVYARLLRGDEAGAQQVRENIDNLQHAGFTQSMQGAYQALQAGNGVGAAQLLARAHAFVPDGQMGRFGVDDKGQVWGEMLSEDSGKPIGRAFQIQPQDIGSMLIQTKDPNQFVKMTDAHREAAAQAEFARQHGKYYGDLLNEKYYAANQRAQTQEDVARTAADSREQVAETRTASRGGVNFGAGNPAVVKQIDAELGKPALTYNISAMQGTPAYGAAAAAYHDIRASNGNSINPATADGIVYQLMQGGVNLNPRTAELTDKFTGRHISYLSPATAEYLMRFLKPVGQPPAARAPQIGGALGAQNNPAYSAAYPPANPGGPLPVPARST